MKIKLQLSDLNEALGFASVVKPVNRDLRAFLFTINEGRCHIHSQDGNNYVRTEVPVSEIEDVEGPASFVYPLDRIEALKFLDGWIEIEAGGDDEGRFWTNYRTEGGAKASRTSYDPRLFSTLSARLAEAETEHTYPTVLLKEGLAVTSDYVADPKGETDSPMHTIQIFDQSRPGWAKGDGTMFASDGGNRLCFFHSPAFAGKGLSIHSKHVARLSSFLGKCHKSVKVKVGSAMSFAIDQVPGPDGAVQDGAVFGWVHHSKQHGDYKAYPPKYDKHRLLVPRDLLLKTLRHVRSEMKDAGREKIRVVYSDKSLKFLGSVDKDKTESAAVPVDPLPLDEGRESGATFASNVNVNFLMGLFEASREFNVELRVAFLDDGKKAFFRTVGRVWIGDSGKSYDSPDGAKEDCYECLVTHFSTSMD